MTSVIRINENQAQAAITHVEDTMPTEDVFSSPAADDAIELKVYDKTQLMNKEVRNIMEIYQQLLKQHTEIARETVDTLIETDFTISKYITNEYPSK